MPLLCDRADVAANRETEAGAGPLAASNKRAGAMAALVLPVGSAWAARATFRPRRANPAEPEDRARPIQLKRPARQLPECREPGRSTARSPAADRSPCAPRAIRASPVGAGWREAGSKTDLPPQFQPPRSRDRSRITLIPASTRGCRAIPSRHSARIDRQWVPPRNQSRRPRASQRAGICDR